MSEAKEILLEDAIEEAIEGRRAERRLKKILAGSVALNLLAAFVLLRRKRGL